MKKKLPLLILMFFAILAVIFAIIKFIQNKNEIITDNYNQQLVSSDKEITDNKIKQEDIIINTSNKKELNITILLDLSDRIAKTTTEKGNESDKGFEPKERDFQIIDTIIEIFKQDAMKGNLSGKKKLINLKNKIRILCIPKPNDTKISFDNLNIDFESNKYNGTNSNLLLKNKQFNDLSLLTKKNDNEEDGEIVKIYNRVLNTKNFPGSDIWKFFEQYAKAFCINKNCRNILVIFTDGYIYHEDSIYQEKNRYSYITGNVLNKYGFRNKNLTLETIKQQIKKYDFGLITRAKNLQGLEVLVVEVLPNKQCKFDGYVIEEVLKKWFNEMGIIHSDILLSSDDKNLTASRIRDFFDFEIQNNN